MRAVVVTALLLAPLLGGCTILQPKPKDVSGPTDGYTPTAAFLKVHVEKENGGFVLVDFDRRDWYVAKIVHRLDVKELEFLSVHATPRDVLGEWLVDEVYDPSDLTSLRFATMGVSEEERMRLDAEYDEILQRLAPEELRSPRPTVDLPSLAKP